MLLLHEMFISKIIIPRPMACTEYSSSKVISCGVSNCDISVNNYSSLHMW